jgi:hypothetical protein
VRQHDQAVSLFSELMSRLVSIGDFVATNYVGDRATIPNPLDKIENAVLINSIANAFNFTTEEKQGVLEEDGRCTRFERFCVLFRFALTELDSVRVPDSGSLH